KSPLLKKNNIMVLDNSKETLEELHQIPHFDAFSELKECVPQADIIFIAVKPFHAESLFKAMQPLVNSEQIIISIMAGVTITSIKELTGLSKIVRAMPNLPAKIGKGVTSFVASPQVSKIEKLTIESLLSTTGTSIQVSNET